MDQSKFGATRTLAADFWILFEVKPPNPTAADLFFPFSKTTHRVEKMLRRRRFYYFEHLLGTGV